MCAGTPLRFAPPNVSPLLMRGGPTHVAVPPSLSGSGEGSNGSPGVMPDSGLLSGWAFGQFGVFAARAGLWVAPALGTDQDVG